MKEMLLNPKATLVNPKSPWLWLLGAVILTITGDLAFQILTGEAFAEWSAWQWIWRIILLLLAVVVTTVTIPRIRFPRLGRRRPEDDTEPAVRELGDISTAPAIIVFVSMNPDGPFRTPITQFANAGASELQHVFLIHSEQSREVANTVYTELGGAENPRFTIHRDGLLADFDNLGDMFRVSTVAVRYALAQEIAPEDIVIDVTGGTAIASAGAVLAGMRFPGVSLTYIPRGGTTIKRVDVGMIPVSVEDEGESGSVLT